MDAKGLFSNKAKWYQKSRPDYAREWIEDLRAKWKVNSDTIIADIGSGTGILSKQLLELGCTVYAVEPNDAMRLCAEQTLGSISQFVSINATAENTTLLEHSVDIVVAAQSFHWFSMDAFRAECQRVLHQDGLVMLVWNMRVQNNEIVKKNKEICQKYCPLFRGFSGNIQEQSEKIHRFFKGSYEKKSYPNSLHYTKEQFIERNLSSSYSLAEKDTHYQAYNRALAALFNQYAKNDTICMPYETVCYVGRCEEG